MKTEFLGQPQFLNDYLDLDYNGKRNGWVIFGLIFCKFLHAYAYIFVFRTYLLRSLLSNGSVNKSQQRDCFLLGPRREHCYATQR
jgi:hypothetical protein